jgi:hypothetical protein
VCRSPNPAAPASSLSFACVSVSVGSRRWGLVAGQIHRGLRLCAKLVVSVAVPPLSSLSSFLVSLFSPLPSHSRPQRCCLSSSLVTTFLWLSILSSCVVGPGDSALILGVIDPPNTPLMVKKPEHGYLTSWRYGGRV